MYNVLIVDDEEIIREGMGLLLDWQGVGFEITAYASNGQEALEILKVGRFDLIVTDIRMPVLDGLAFIRKLRETAPFMKIIIISGFNEFTYAQQAIALGVRGFLLKPIDRQELAMLLASVKAELNDEITAIARETSMRDAVKNRFFHDLFRSGLTDAELEAGDRAGWLSLGAKNYLSVLIELDQLRGIAEEALVRARAIRNTAISTSMRIVSNVCCGTVYEEEHGLIGIVFFKKGVQTTADMASETLDEILNGIATQTGMHVTAAVGGEVMHISELRLSRMQAEEALGRILFSRDKEKIAIGIYANGQPLWDIQWSGGNLLKAIDTGNQPAMLAEIDMLVREVSTHSSPVLLANTMIYSILMDIAKTIRHRNGGLESFMEADIVKHIGTLEELKQSLTGICEQAIKVLMELSDRTHPRLIDQILEYIDAHFMEDLTLKEISQQFFMNTSYLGQLFRKATQESFNDYVNKRRIEEAKRMMLEKNVKMSTIIESVGYKNPQHFYKLFLRIEGMTVQAYRKKQGEY